MRIEVEPLRSLITLSEPDRLKETMPKFRSADHRMIESVGWRPQEPAERANDHIWYSRGTTNSNLVVTAAGDVVINTGLAAHAPRHKERYEQALGRPLNVKKIV